MIKGRRLLMKLIMLFVSVLAFAGCSTTYNKHVAAKSDSGERNPASIIKHGVYNGQMQVKGDLELNGFPIGTLRKPADGAVRVHIDNPGFPSDGINILTAAKNIVSTKRNCP